MASMSYSKPGRDSFNDDLIDPDDPSLNDFDDPLSARPNDREPLTGSIQPDAAASSSSSFLPRNYLNQSIPGEDRRAPSDTLDESVWATLSRDLRAVWEKLQLVLWPKHLLGGVLTRPRGGLEAGDGEERESLANNVRNIVGQLGNADTVLQGTMSEGLRDWDLWGPLLFCLLLSLFLSLRASHKQKELVFSGVFTIIWLGEAVVTMQIKLLGGTISFFQSVCIIGYTLFPLVIASMLSAIGIPVVARIPVYIVLVLWSLAAGVSILGGSGVIKNRVALAVYPMFVFYIGLGALCFIS